MAMILSISYYLMTVLISCAMAARYYRKMKQNSPLLELCNVSRANEYKLTLGMILVITLLFTSYNVLVTKSSVVMGGDRQNFALNFYGIRPSPSAGLMFIISIIRKFTSNVEWLWYVGTLISMPITLFAYRISPDATPKALLFFLTTQYVFTTFVNMKQCYANGLISLCFVLALRDRGKHDKIACVTLTLVAYLFHQTALFALPLCFIMWKKRRRTDILVYFIALTAFLFLLKPLLRYSVEPLSFVAPWLSDSISHYIVEMEESMKTAESSLLTSMKGLPFYILTALCLLKRRNLKGKIRNYDNYLILSGTLSLVYIASFYNGWIYRLAYYLYLPVAIFYCQIMCFVRGWEKRLLLYGMVMGVNFLVTIRFLILIYLNYGGF